MTGPQRAKPARRGPSYEARTPPNRPFARGASYDRPPRGRIGPEGPSRMKPVCRPAGLSLWGLHTTGLPRGRLSQKALSYETRAPLSRPFAWRTSYDCGLTGRTGPEGPSRMKPACLATGLSRGYFIRLPPDRQNRPSAALSYEARPPPFTPNLPLPAQQNEAPGNPSASWRFALFACASYLPSTSVRTSSMMPIPSRSTSSGVMSAGMSLSAESPRPQASQMRPLS